MQRKIKNIFIYSFLTLAFFGMSFESVQADAWWGEGYRTPQWVLTHGGTIINYTIVNAPSPKKYKAMMFRGGQYVEVEFGNNAQFDDAKNGSYVINFYKCDGSCMDHKFDKKTKIRSKDKLITSINVVARPGQTNDIIFDAAAKKAFIAGQSGGVVNAFVAQREEAKEQEGGAQRYSYAKKKNCRFDQMTYLSPRTDFSQFEAQNIASGIVPNYNKLQDS